MLIRNISIPQSLKISFLRPALKQDQLKTVAVAVESVCGRTFFFKAPLYTRIAVESKGVSIFSDVYLDTFNKYIVFFCSLIKQLLHLNLFKILVYTQFKLIFLTQKDYEVFFKNFFFAVKNLSSVNLHTKVLRWEGPSIKISLTDSLNSKKETLLSLKVGYSHIVLLPVPLGVNLKLFKTKILVWSSNSLLVNSFSISIKNLNPLNPYTGKGFWVRSFKKIELKEIKKV